MLYSKKELDYELSYVKDLINGISKKTIQDRVRNILEWDIRKAHIYRSRYFASLALATVCNIAIPVLVLFHQVDAVSIIVAILSAVSSVGMMLNANYKWQDNWIRSRRNVEKIKNKTVLYVQHYESYGDESTADELFVREIEGIVMEDEVRWYNMQARQAARAGQGDANTPAV